MATKTKKKPNKNPNRKVGQIWRVGSGNDNYPFYRLHGRDLEIVNFEGFGNSIIRLLDVDNEREYVISRRHLTTSGDQWSFVGVADGEPKPWTVFCRSCSSARVVVAPRRPSVESCSYCGVR